MTNFLDRLNAQIARRQASDRELARITGQTVAQLDRDLTQRDPDAPAMVDALGVSEGLRYALGDFADQDARAVDGERALLGFYAVPVGDDADAFEVGLVVNAGRVGFDLVQVAEHASSGGCVSVWHVHDARAGLNAIAERLQAHGWSVSSLGTPMMWDAQTATIRGVVFW